MISDLEKLIISPPFGNYLNFRGATSVRGSYTLFPRPGLIKQVIKTLRPTEDGWVNKIGLRNPGVASLINYNPTKPYICSVTAGEMHQEWKLIFEIIKLIPHIKYIELNLGCPNVSKINLDYLVLKEYLSWYTPNNIILKLPPTITLGKMAEYQYLGAKWFHLSNTVPSPNGGISGPEVKKRSLPLITCAKEEFGDIINIIAGGGIYTFQDLLDYKNAGADKFSLSTVFFNPRNAWKIFDTMYGYN